MCISHVLGKIKSSVLLAGVAVLFAAVGDCIVLETPTILNHITKLSDGGLAVGAVNHVYVVNSDLTVLQNVSTGPVNDSRDCSPSTCSCTKGVMTNNYNKILVMHNDTLITCGNVRKGTCEVRRLCNISDYTADRRVETMVAPCTTNASTIAVVIPYKDAICVGSTRTGGNKVPAISTRNITNLKVIGSAKISFSNVNSAFSYKFGFHRDRYTFFLFAQTAVDSPNVSKIARICDDDAAYYSYIEIPMECKLGSASFDTVRAGTVTKLGDELASAIGVSSGEDVLVTVFHNNGVTEKSAICIYRFENITTKINDNGNECFQKGKFTNARYYFQGNRKCEAQTTDYSAISCGELALDLDYFRNTPVVGTIPVTPVLTFEVQAQVTSIAVKTIKSHTVVYAGTSDGVFKKIHIRNATMKRTFKNLKLGDVQVMEDMLYDERREHIYVMSGTKLHKLQTYECNKFTSCGECVSARDPHCGWCTLENKCSLESECKAVGVPKKWYSYDDDPGQCIVFSKIEPTDRLSTHHRKIRLNLTISHLPEDNTYTCVFGKENSTPATKTSYGVHCDTPDPSTFQTDDSDHTVVALSLNSSETGILFISKDFTFFSCSFHKMCIPCTASKWDCYWCVFDHKCVHSTDNAVCKPGNVTTNSSCPRIDLSTPPILLPSGYKKQFVLKTKELPTPSDDQSGYECKVKVNDRTFTASVSIKGENVTCLGNTEYFYTESDGRKKVNISLIWNGDFEIDNSNQVSAEMYKCPLMGPECGICHNLNESYRCAWNDKCVYEPSGVKNPCQHITIKTVFPLNTTIEGGSNITLTGVNLGYSPQSVKRAVTLAGVTCESMDDKYVVSQKIVCRSGQRTTPVAGNIKVTVQGVSETFSSRFEYKNPIIFDVRPKRGPKSGGTRITIIGESLETGSLVGNEVSLDGVLCEILDRADNRTICVLRGVETQGNRSQISMMFENEAKRNHSLTYIFTEDPTISGITPLKAFVAGGRKITVTGTSFTYIQKPMLFVRNKDGASWETACHRHNDTLMICSSPNVPPDASGNDLTIGFIMDNVTAVRNMKENFPNVSSSMTFVANPEFFNFTEKVKELKEPKLIITGNNLNLASSEEEVTVTIGNEVCNVTLLAKAEMVCTAPEKQPRGIDKDGQWSKDVLPAVTVRVGNLKFFVGKVRYYTYGLSPGAIGGIVVGLTVPLIIIVILVVFCHRKSHKEQRNYKKMQIQLETLESNVRDECRLAFAELQTDMSDLTSDLVTSGIPFLDFKTYIDKVLFPGNSVHPSLHKEEDQTKYRGMDQFGQILLNKHFLLKLTRTLEDQKTFGVRDKANVASLLMVVLADQMEYATEILTTLLGELIERCVEQKRAKLLLRRTESVVEKMLTHWLSICMYEYMQGSSGQALFIMFKSVKHQIEKGPVDAITGDARYSLAENRLLLEKIEPLTLTVEIMLENGDTIPDVKVLDCDTITQVKEKLLDATYRNAAYSERILSQETELEWRHGRSGHLTLSDDDITSVVEDGWKKLNTLNHYKVQSNSQMAVVSKQYINCAETQNGVSDADMVTLTMNEERSNKCWHLVKTDDMEQRDESKVISEIFLTRLLSTKGTLQQFVDDFVQSILRVDQQLPPAIKYLFDFLDESAKQHGITDPEVVFTWKSNSLPLRFWVNVIKNPDYVFDINKSDTVDSSLSVIAQTFMDSCSTAEQRLGKDSPTNKLLFAKDIVKYKKFVEDFYEGVQELPPQSEQEMHSAMVHISRNVPKTFNKPAALRELFDYVTKYDTEITSALEEDFVATKAQLPQKLERVKSAVYN